MKTTGNLPPISSPASSATDRAGGEHAVPLNSRGDARPQPPGSFHGVLYRLGAAKSNGTRGARTSGPKLMRKPRRLRAGAAGDPSEDDEIDVGDEAEDAWHPLAGTDADADVSHEQADGQARDSARRAAEREAPATLGSVRLAIARPLRERAAQRFVAARWPGADTLFDSGAAAAATPRERLRAMAVLMLRAAPARPGESAGCFAAALRANLAHETQPEPGLTLAEVRALLIEASRERPAAARADERTQTANLLLPLQLLITALPRTPRQRSAAIARLDLAERLARSPLASPR